MILPLDNCRISGKEPQKTHLRRVELGPQSRSFRLPRRPRTGGSVRDLLLLLPCGLRHADLLGCAAIGAAAEATLGRHATRRRADYWSTPSTRFYPVPSGHPRSTSACLCRGMHPSDQQRVVSSDDSYAVAARSGRECENAENADTLLSSGAERGPARSCWLLAAARTILSHVLRGQQVLPAAMGRSHSCHGRVRTAPDMVTLVFTMGRCAIRGALARSRVALRIVPARTAHLVRQCAAKILG